MINSNVFLEYFLQVSFEILPQAAKKREMPLVRRLASHLSKFQRFSSSLLKKTLSRKTISFQNSITIMNAFIPNDKQVLVSKRRKHCQSHGMTVKKFSGVLFFYSCAVYIAVTSYKTAMKKYCFYVICDEIL